MNFSWAEMPRNLEISFKYSVEATENTTTLCKLHMVSKGFRPMNLMLSLIECFHMTSWRPYWFPKPVLRELNSFLVQTLSFVPINLHICCPREWKHSISQIFSLYLVTVPEVFAKVNWSQCFSRFSSGEWLLLGQSLFLFPDPLAVFCAHISLRRPPPPDLNA